MFYCFLNVLIFPLKMTSTIAGCDHLQYICFWYYTLDAEESGFSVFIAVSFSYEADRLLHVVLVLRLLVIAPFSNFLSYLSENKCFRGNELLHFRLSIAFYLFLKSHHSCGNTLESFHLGPQTLLFNFVQSHVLLISCLEVQASLFTTSSPLSPLHLEGNVSLCRKLGRVSLQIVCKLYGDSTRLLILNTSDLLK